MVAILKAWNLSKMLADFEAALQSLSHPALKTHSDAIASLIAPGSQAWRVLRIVEQHR